MTQVHVNYVFTVPFKGSTLGTESTHTKAYPRGTPWEVVAKDWESDSWGPLNPIRIEYESWAWPGGYPLYYVTKDGGILCPKAANEEFDRTFYPDDEQFYIIGCEINWEDPDLICDHTNERIPSAYAEDDAHGF